MIHAIVVDDEKPSCDDLANLLIASGMVRLLACFTEPLAALEFIKTNSVDAVFLDIEMPEINGIELSGRIICLQKNIAIVFVTAYNDYAVEAFRINALDYLMKPAEEERVLETLNRIIDEKRIPAQTKQVRVQCFGKFTVETEYGRVKFRTKKSEELFAFLIEKRGFVSRTQILDSFWEDFDGDRAVVHFNSTLYNVKKALLAHGIGITVEQDHGNYRLDIAELDCDYLKFQEHISRSQPVTGANLSDCEAAVQLYKGEYLSGTESLWADKSRQMLRELYVGLLLRTEEYYRTKKRYDKTAEFLKAALVYEPLNKELYTRLIQALLAMDDRASAEQYYEFYQNAYKMKFKQEVDPEIKKLLNKR